MAIDRKVNHLIMLIRQRELNQYHIPVQQTHVLRTINELGENATLAELAKEVEREIHVISRQAVGMEKEGLIKRAKKSPKSKLLRLELTEKVWRWPESAGRVKPSTRYFHHFQRNNASNWNRF